MHSLAFQCLLRMVLPGEYDENYQTFWINMEVRDKLEDRTKRETQPPWEWKSAKYSKMLKNTYYGPHLRGAREPTNAIQKILLF